MRRGLREPERHEVLGTGQGEQPEHPADIPAQPPAADQDHPIGQFGVLVGELHGDPAAQRLADHRDRAETQHGQQVPQSAGERSQQVVVVVIQNDGGMILDIQQKRQPGCEALVDDQLAARVESISAKGPNRDQSLNVPRLRTSTSSSSPIRWRFRVRPSIN